MKGRVVEVFLSIDLVSYKRPIGASPWYREERPTRYRAKWIARGTSAELYASKVSTDRAEVVKLALAHLARLNKSQGPNFEATYGCKPTTYVDTTPQPERFGYEHGGAS